MSRAASGRRRTSGKYCGSRLGCVGRSTRIVPDRFLYVLLLGIFLLAGCGGTRVTRENFNRVQAHMPRGEVERILGPPDQSYQGILTWRGSHPDELITIVFDEEHRVSEKEITGFPAP